MTRQRLSRRARFQRCAAFALAFAASIVSGGLSAQSTATPSADQLDMLRNLTPEQRDAILQQVGGASGGSSSGAATRSGTSQLGSGGRDPAAIERDRRVEAERLKAEKDELFPVLKAEDTVLLSIEYPPSESARATTPRAAVQPSPAQGAGATGAPSAQQPPPQNARSRPTDGEPPLTELQKRDLDKLIDLVRAGNPYRLDRTGAIQLPGFPAIPLAGLSEEQATMRLQAEAAFRRLDIKLTRLPLERSGVERLKPFGYDLFENAPSTFAPVTDVPVPADYVVGAGDVLEVQLFGSQNRTLRLTVGRDGRISFPELGPISVAGERFSSAKANIEAQVSRQMIGVRASVSMGDTRSIRVFVLGEAKFPGSYTVSGLATITSALFASGGIKPIGSLRDIQLKRQGAVVRRLDLYDLLIRGDTRDDAQLLPGDVIFIPAVGPTVSIDGEVHRPAIYELKGDSQVADLLQLAGGLTPEADTGKASLARVDEARRRIVVDVDLSAAAGRSTRLRNGDAMRVNRLRPQLDAGVQLSGHVYRPGAFAWHEGMRLTEVLGSVDEVKPDGDLGYVLIRRELPPDRHIAVVSADLNAALRDPASAANVTLMPRDRITVFDLASGRERILSPLINELRVQGGFDRPTEVVRVEGRVKVPGEYPLEPHMKVGDLIRAGGSLADAAYGGTAELTRYEVVKGESRQTELLEVDLAAVRRGDPKANLELRPFDYLNIKEVPAWGKFEQVSLEGEVRFPGVYPIRHGETLRAVLDRAGGLTDLAFPQGAVFTREELRQREQQQLDVLQVRLQKDLTILALRGAAANQTGANTALQVGQSLLGQIQSARAVGRLVINLDQIYAGRTGAEQDVALRDGDRLIVPKQRQEITVIGEVQNATSLFYRHGLTVDDYIRLSGGITRQADKDKIYVVRANGSVVPNGNNRWFSRGSGIAMRAGDTIVVPLDTEKIPALPLWQAVTQILYNIAVAVAAVHSL